MATANYKVHDQSFGRQHGLSETTPTLAWIRERERECEVIELLLVARITGDNMRGWFLEDLNHPFVHIFLIKNFRLIQIIVNV